MQIGFYFDQTRCIGCFTGVVACKDAHDVAPGSVSWRRVTEIESGKFPGVSVTFLSSSCYHCRHPVCISVCAAGAIYKRETDGIVVVDTEKCLKKDDCGLCGEARPYGAPQFGAEENAKMEKCDLCLDRLSAGKSPICVGACRTRALDAGPMDELKSKYGRANEATGMVYSMKIEPSIIFKSKNQMASPHLLLCAGWMRALKSSNK